MRESVSESFQAFATAISVWVGTKWAFAAAVLAVAVWASCGPHFHYSDTWQLVVNTATTIITFIMVFLIQSTQNRDARAIHLKLDELIRALRRANDSMIDIEHLSDEELAALTKQYETFRATYERRTKTRESADNPVSPRHKR